ncbi:polyphosphate polymerase domain-containing protein [Paenibacillus oenotherae]|uniref:Polyphosphate polymerase domain-containing protein n=1 Tax=Paenibacillus oenotherae TaxID=1435645 RepID=A0ABS7D6F6_9BACL|nr:polyphosphate polymerase domain-containing protein [Paenibacillus oenotherae]MBW7474743.1 polyphosphate polymerase domain-containing protein [Paenibacillus oenotherae]
MQFDGKKLRHEMKYYIHYHEAQALRDRVGAVLMMDKNSIGREGYHIRSLYFDDMHETSLLDKNNGVFRRKKYRIRIYNKSDAVIKLERKSKYHDYIAKESASMTREEYERIISGDIDFMRDAEHKLIRDFYYDCKHGLMKPGVVVDYVREAYIFPISDVRITFDKQLKASIQSLDIFDVNLPMVESIEGPKTILEVKYNQFLPDFVYGLIQMSAHQRSTISKYVICRERRKSYAD